mmetsp:Transcript_43248/g.78710  ORF Transcript_43248/g.78710 Transcript_43248/m.78710 type:complete len:357 (-) Transcript_43248:63-1133(-)
MEADDTDAAAEVIINQFKKDMHKGMTLPVLTVDKGESEGLVKLNKRLTTLTIDGKKKRTVKLRHIKQVYVGEEGSHTQIAAGPLSVTLLLDTGKVYGFRFVDEDGRDTFGMCLAMFVEDAKVMPADAGLEGEGEDEDKEAMVTDELAAAMDELEAEEEEGEQVRKEAPLPPPREVPRPAEPDEPAVAGPPEDAPPGDMALRPSPPVKEEQQEGDDGKAPRPSEQTAAAEDAEEFDSQRRPRRGNCWTRCFIGRRGEEDDDNPRGLEPFHVVLQRSGGKVGMLIGAHMDDPEKVIVREVVRTGLVYRWNEENPTRSVEAGCQIMEINGFTDRTQMIQCITDPDLLQIDLLVRPAQAV